MSSFSKKMQLPYTESKGYSFIEKNYETIRSICEDNFTVTEIKLFLLYNDGDITCTVDSIENFKLNSYGSNEVDITSMTITVCTKDIGDISFLVGSERINVLSDSKIHLSKIIGIFNEYETNSKRKFQTSENITHTHYNIEAQNIENSNIGGSGNTVAVINSDTHEEKRRYRSKSAQSSFWKGLLQGVVANYVWWIVGLLSVGAISMYKEHIITFLSVQK